MLKLQDLTLSNTEHFTLKSTQLHKCKLISVIDGDTVKVAFKPFGIFSKYWVFNVRLLDFDAPETRTKDHDEKLKGVEARNWLVGLLTNPIVWLECGDFDNFGRILGYLFLDESRNVSVNELMKTHLGETSEASETRENSE